MTSRSALRGPLIAVVGHTNTGKTSLLRTLLRDPTFGEVSARPATTRHAERAELRVEGSGGAVTAIAVTDTPGLEDASGLLEHLETGGPSARSGAQGDPHARIEAWLAEAGSRFTQEAKAIRQVLESDVAIYVIDARERMLGRHRDELTILSWCARPLVPVLNFVASPEADVAGWRGQLARLGLHAVVSFDTVLIDEASERRLVEALRALAPEHQPALDAFLAERDRQRRERIDASASLIADMLIDAAACVTHVDPRSDASVQAGVDALQGLLRERERRCAEELLAIHRFRPGDAVENDLAIAEGRFGLDLFDPAAMRQLGLSTSRGAAVGAVAGLAIDAMLGGMTLGAAAATGAGVGAVLETARGHGARWWRRLRGETELRADDATLHLMALRSIALTRALLRRGHAAQKPTQVGQEALLERVRGAARAASGWNLPAPLKTARAHPRWSSLGARTEAIGGFDVGTDAWRARALSETHAIVRTALERPAEEPARFP